MQISRRNFVAGGSLAATFSALSCRGGGGSSSSVAPPGPPPGTSNSFEQLILNRGAYGPRPGEVEALAARGLEDWLDEQLNPGGIDDSVVDEQIAALEYYNLSAEELKLHHHLDVQLDLGRATILRALLSRRQLWESMVEFWSDHFHMALAKLPYLTRLRVVYDRDVLRRHAFGRVRDIVLATARSPAMLVSLDNVLNEKWNINENYARELMELHTLGVDAGYTQADVEELGRALTGWSVAATDSFVFHEEGHDAKSKRVFGMDIGEGGGVDEVERLIDYFVSRPEAAQFICTKLVRRFVADDPPQSLVDRVVTDYQTTGGDVKVMLRTIFLSPEFADAPRKVKRPYKYAVSCLRALDVDPRVIDYTLQFCAQMGQPLFHWPMPDGYPDTSEVWTAGLLSRWNWCLSLLNGELGAVNDAVARSAAQAVDIDAAVDSLAKRILGRSLEVETQTALVDYIGPGLPLDPAIQARLRDAVALMFAHPEFQWA